MTDYAKQAKSIEQRAIELLNARSTQAYITDARCCAVIEALLEHLGEPMSASVTARRTDGVTTFSPVAKTYFTGSAPPALDACPGIWSRVRGTADHVCPHGVTGGRCCPLPPREAVTPHEGLRLEVRGDQLRVEADHGDGRRIYRLWQLEDGVLPTAALRLTEALAVQQLAQIAPVGGDPPLGWRHCAADEELVTEARQVAVATLDPSWKQEDDGAWLLSGLPLGLSAAVYPPEGASLKYHWEIGVGIDELAMDEAETLTQAQEAAEAAVLRLVDEAGGALRERHDRRRRVAEAVQAAPIPEVP